MNFYLLLLALHLIGLISWMAGLLYLVRILIYHSEALEKDQPGKVYLSQQFVVMARRLHRVITLPAALFTALVGILLMFLTHAYFQAWFHLKLTLLLILFGYHAYAYYLVVKFRTATTPYRSSRFLRYYNELATLLMIMIVLTAVMKNIPQTLLSLLGIVSVSMILTVFFLLGKKLTRSVHRPKTIKR